MIDVKKIQRIFVSGKFDPIKQKVIPKFDLDAKMSLQFLRMAGVETQQLIWVSPLDNLEKINKDYRLKNDVLLDVGQVQGPFEFSENCVVFDHHHESSLQTDDCSAEQVVSYFKLPLNENHRKLLGLIHTLDCEPDNSLFRYSDSWKIPILLVSRLNGEQILTLSDRYDLSVLMTDEQLLESGLNESAQSKKKSLEKVVESLKKAEEITTKEGEKILVIRHYRPSASFLTFEKGYSFASFTSPTWAINFREKKSYIPAIYERMNEGVLVRETMIIQNKGYTQYDYFSFVRKLKGEL